MKLTIEQRKRSLELFRMDSSDDPWGDGMRHFFAAADVLHHAGAPIPPRWQYQHGPLEFCNPIPSWHGGQTEHPNGEPCNCSWPESEPVPFLDAGDLGIEMLTYAGNVLDRYLAFVKRAGKDY